MNHGHKSIKYNLLYSHNIMKHYIGVDCDEVLAESIKCILEHEPLKNKNISFNDITSYYLRDIKKFWLTKEEWIDIFFSFFDSPEYFKTKAVNWAYEKLKEIKKSGHKLAVVTARDEKFKKQTIEWVNQHFPEIFDDFLFMNQFSEKEISKGELCKNFWIELLIDDNITNIENVNKEGIPWILLRKPRNTNAKENKLMKIVDNRENISLNNFISSKE